MSLIKRKNAGREIHVTPCIKSNQNFTVAIKILFGTGRNVSPVTILIVVGVRHISKV